MGALVEGLPLAVTPEGNTVVAAPAKRGGLDAQKDNIAQLSEISKNSQATFLAVILASVYSYLTIATTTDAALLSNSNATALPLLQANVPIVWFYYFAPLIVTVLFIYFHVYLDGFWRGLARLPLRHPDDGRGLDDYIYPWLISCALIRAELRQRLHESRTSARLEAWVSLFLGWWLVPTVLLFYWARYVIAHDPFGTVLHITLVVLSVAVGMTYLFVAGNSLKEIRSKDAEQEAGRARDCDPTLSLGQRLGIVATALSLCGSLGYLSAAALSPSASNCQQSDHPGCKLFAGARIVWRNVLQREPYADVREVRFMPRPDNWTRLVNDPVALAYYLEGQRGLTAIGQDLNSMLASSAFLPGSRFAGVVLDRADLSHAVLTASRFDGVSLEGANLRGAVLTRAQIRSALFHQVSAVESNFDHASFAGPSEAPTSMTGDFSNATFDDSTGTLHIGSVQDDAKTKLFSANLRRVNFGYTTFDRVDVNDALIVDARIVHSDFVDSDFSGTTISDSFFNFSTFRRCRFVGTIMDRVYFEEASFEDSELGDSRASAGSSRAPVQGFIGVKARFDETTRLTNLEFRRAELRHARFTRTKLVRVVFSESDLSSAQFDGVDFDSVIFEGVDLSGADLSTATNLSAASLTHACGNQETRLPPGLKVSRCRPGVRP